MGGLIDPSTHKKTIAASMVVVVVMVVMVVMAVVVVVVANVAVVVITAVAVLVIEPVASCGASLCTISHASACHTRTQAKCCHPCVCVACCRIHKPSFSSHASNKTIVFSTHI